MPQSFLHIQADDSPATRMLELSGTSVRIGRGVQCEVRLNEPALAEVQCMLRRRGESWYVQPVGPPGRISLAGRPVDAQQPLPVGTALRVGSHWLALQPLEAAPDELGSFASPIPVESRPEADPVPVALTASNEPSASEPAAAAAPSPSVAGLEAERERLERRQARLEQRERWLKARQDERKWEARWTAAGASLRARSAPSPVPEPVPVPRPPAPVAEEVEARRNGWQAAPVPSWSDAPSVNRIVPSARPRVVSEPPPPAPPPRVVAPAGPGLRPAAMPDPPAPPPRVVAPAGPDLSPAAMPDPPRLEPQARLSQVRDPVPADWPVPRTAPAPSPRPRTEPAARSSPSPAAEPAGRPRQSPPPFRVDSEPAVSEAVGVPRRPAAPSARCVVPEPAPPRARATDQPIRDNRPARPDARSPSVQPSVRHETVVVRPPATEPTPAPLDRLPDGPEWPTAAAIFAARPRREPAAAPSRTAARPKPARPTPTVAIAPDQWSVPFWPAWTASAAAAFLVSLVGLALGWCWGLDDAAAGRVADRVLAPMPPGSASAQAAAKPFDPQDAPALSWWRSTSGHLFAWAVAEHRSGSDAQQVDAFLQAARSASPLHAGARFAEEQSRAGQNPGEGLASSFGLSRDIVALAWAAHRLRLAGKAETALRAYATALDLAARADLADQPPPAFSEEEHRFRLPYEDLIRPIVLDMAENSAWSFSQWSPALPPFAVAPLVAGRVLRELGRTAESEQALDLAIECSREPAAPGVSAAVHVAAGAEALALRQRWRETEEAYQSALEQLPHDFIRRTWWYNLADVYQQLNDDRKRLAAWESARGTDPRDAITKQVVAAMIRAGVAPAPAAKNRPGKAASERLDNAVNGSTTPDSESNAAATPAR